MIGCIFNLSNSLTISFICAVMSLFWTMGSEVISKCGLLRYYFAVFKVFLYSSLSSVLLSAFLKVYFYCVNAYNCWAVTIAFMWATSPKGVVMKEVSILGSVRMFWFKVIGSLGLRNYACPCANTQRTPIEQALVVSQWRQRVVLYFWLKMGFISYKSIINGFYT